MKIPSVKWFYPRDTETETGPKNALRRPRTPTFQCNCVYCFLQHESRQAIKYDFHKEQQRKVRRDQQTGPQHQQREREGARKKSISFCFHHFHSFFLFSTSLAPFVYCSVGPVRSSSGRGAKTFSVLFFTAHFCSFNFFVLLF